MHPELLAIRIDKPQLAILGCARCNESFLAQVVNVPVLFEDDTEDRLFDQRAGGGAQQVGGSAVCLQDQTLLTDGAVTHRGHVI